MCNSLTASWDTCIKMRKEFGIRALKKHLRKLQPTSTIFLNPSCFLWSSKSHYLNLIDKRMEALGPPKVTSLQGWSWEKSCIPHHSEKFLLPNSFASAQAWCPGHSLYCSLAIFTSFYFPSKQNYRTVSVPATASPFQMVWLSFPQYYFLTFSSLQLAEQRIRINWIKQKKVFFWMACKYYLFSPSSGTQQLPVPALH